MKNSKTLFRITGVLFALVMVITLVSMKPTKASSMTFTVSYDANGGSNAPAKQSGTRGYPLKLSSAVPTRDGYKFVGWSTSKNGELEFAPGGSYTRSTDVTLYAKWQANIYYVYFDANGGSNAPARQVKSHGTNITIKADVPTRTGHTFAGWATKPGGGVEYVPGSVYSKNATVTFYAVWQPIAYAVKYYANGGSNPPANQTKYYGINLTLSSVKPTRTGYSFVGWSSTKDGNPEFAAGGIYDKNANVNLYAKWQANLYYVNFDANGGKNAPSRQVKSYGSNITITTAKPTRDGYTFQGWSTTKDGAVVYSAGATYSDNKTVTLYAKWKLNTYAIKYDANGGSGAPANQTKTHGTNITLSSAKPTRSGYAFKGWSTVKDGAVKYAAGAAYTANEAVTLYAKWVKTYTVSYVAKDASNVPAAQTKEHGVALTLSTKKPTKTGYTFVGWSSTDGGELEYAAGGSYTKDTNITLYAKWQINTYAVTFNTNGGSTPPAKQTKTYGQTLKLTTAVPTRSGFTFMGWATSASGSVAYAAGGNYTKNEAVTLYAVWAKNYAVTYNANGGSGAPAAQTKVHGVSLTLQTTKPGRTGYTFQGWAITKDGAVKYAAGAAYTANEAVTLYAVWKLNTYAVKYDANGGTGAPGNQTKNYGTTLTLSSTKPTRSGYIFKGWSTVKDGAVKYAAGSAYTANEAVTLYAKWVKAYTVSYVAKDASNVPAAQTKEHGVALTLSKQKPTKTGYTFVGWSSTDGGELEFAAGGSYDKDANVILYAKWQANIYYVNYDANGGSNAPARQAKSHGTSITLTTAKPNRTGYTFQGWSAVKDGAVKYTGGETYTDNKTITLYAVWKLNEYTIKFDANGGTGAPGPQTKTHGTNITLSSTKPTRTGFTFVGWASKKDGNLEFAAGGIYDKDANVILYAKWQANIYYVNYDANGGSNAPARQVKSHGTSITLTTAKPNRTGYTFQGWSAVKDGAVKYTGGETYTDNKTITLYAVWKLNEYTIKFDANGGTGAPGPQTKTHGTNITLSSTKPTRTGFTFVGWASKKDGTLEFAAGGIYDKDANVILYAKWQANIYYVNYDANGGSNAPARQAKSHGTNITLTTAKPNRTGYTFQGWSAVKDGAVKYTGGETYTDNKTITLYAVWKLNEYTIKFDANGGTGAPGPQTKTHGTNLTLSTAKPTRTGYTFVGWSSTKDGDLEYAAGGTYDKNANITLFAKWQIITYYVNYSANGGINAPAKQSKNYGTNITLTKSEPTREGYTFLGWATSANGSVVYAAGATYSENKTINLYAVWARIVSQKVIFYSDDPKSGRPYEKVYEANIASGTTEWTFPNPENLVLDDDSQQHYYDYYDWATVGREVTNDTLISPGEKVKVANIPFKDGTCEFYAFTPYYFVNYHVYLSDDQFSTDRTEHVLDKEYKAKEVWTQIEIEHEDETKSLLPEVYVGLNTAFDKNGNIQVKGNNNTIVDVSWLKDSNRPSPYLGYRIAHVIGWTTNPNNPTIIYKPGDIVDLASQGRNVDLYALWAPRELDYFPNEKPCYWMGFEYDGTPCMSFYLTADQVGTGTIANAVKGSSDPDAAWRTRASKSFASVVYEAVESRPTKKNIEWFRSISQIVISTLTARLEGGFYAGVAGEKAEKAIQLVESKDFQAALEGFQTTGDIVNVFLYMMYNPDTLQKLQYALLNLGIKRENGVVAGEHAKAIRVDLRFGGEEVYITELTSNTLFGRCNVDDEGMWVKRSEDPEYFEKLLELTVPEYKEYFFGASYKTERAEVGNADQSLKNYIWIGGTKGKDGKYDQIYAKMYIPKRYAGTGSLKSVLSKQGNADSLWKQACNNSVIANIAEAFEHKKMPSEWWLRIINGAVEVVDGGLSLIAETSPFMDGVIAFVEGTVSLGADVVFNNVNHGKIEELVDDLRDMYICRSAGIVYNPKNICIEIRKTGDSVTIEEYGYNPDLSKSPIEGIEGRWIEEGSEDYEVALRTCINMIIGDIKAKDVNMN